MNIVTSPEVIVTNDLSMLWIAWDEDSYTGPNCPMGQGPTEGEAISDLIDQLGELLK